MVLQQHNLLAALKDIFKLHGVSVLRALRITLRNLRNIPVNNAYRTVLRAPQNACIIAQIVNREHCKAVLLKLNRERCSACHSSNIILCRMQFFIFSAVLICLDSRTLKLLVKGYEQLYRAVCRSAEKLLYCFLRSCVDNALPPLRNDLRRLFVDCENRNCNRSDVSCFIRQNEFSDAV